MSEKRERFRSFLSFVPNRLIGNQRNEESGLLHKGALIYRRSQRQQRGRGHRETVFRFSPGKTPFRVGSYQLEASEVLGVDEADGVAGGINHHKIIDALLSDGLDGLGGEGIRL